MLLIEVAGVSRIFVVGIERNTGDISDIGDVDNTADLIIGEHEPGCGNKLGRVQRFNGPSTNLQQISICESNSSDV